jgi:predicted NodU family carbamoyl transferase
LDVENAHSQNQLQTHDLAATIVRDGEILFATGEERLSRKKHDGAFRLHAKGLFLRMRA